ncbi:MAG: hypothetical protein ACRDK2_01820 [Solirubrobacteraceae bacterium]
MANWSSSLLTGAMMGLFVSVIPGINGALCLQLAQRDARAARPLILTIALSDFSYCLLSSLGLLAIAHTHAGLLRWLGPGFAALAAVAIWPSPRRARRQLGYFALVAFNPSTVALWMGLAALSGHATGRGIQAAAALALGALLGSALWFCALAHFSARLGRRARWLRAESTARFLSATLAGLSLLRLLFILG